MWPFDTLHFDSKAAFYSLFIVGQMWVRLNLLNGSLDKPWLLLPFFWVPPLSLLPAGMAGFGYIQKGQTGDPRDDSLSAMCLSIFGVSIILDFIPGINPLLPIFLKPLINFCIIFYGLSQRDKKICKNNDTKETNYYRDLISSSRINIAIALLPFVLRMVPLLPLLESAIGFISPTLSSIVENLIQMLATYLALLIYYMWEGTNLDKHCSYVPTGKETTMYILGAFGLNIGIQYGSYLKNKVVSTGIGIVLDETNNDNE